MILAHRDRHQAVFLVGEAYVSVAVEAWSSDGEPMSLGRDGRLVSVVGHPQLVRVIPAIPGGSGADREAWFRRAIGLESDAPLTGYGTHRASLTAVRPCVPVAVHHVPEAE